MAKHRTTTTTTAATRARAAGCNVEAGGCGRTEERTRGGWRTIRLNAAGLCGACAEALAEGATAIRVHRYVHAGVTVESLDPLAAWQVREIVKNRRSEGGPNGQTR